MNPNSIDFAGSTNKPGTLTEYHFSGAGGYMVQVMTRNMNYFQATTNNAVYMEGKTGTVQSTIRMRFYSLVPDGMGGFSPGPAVPLPGIHFELRDAESSEWIYNFGVDTTGTVAYDAAIGNQTAITNYLDFSTDPVFAWSNGVILKDANPNYASNGAALESGTQDAKTLDVNLSNLPITTSVYGFEFSLIRNSSSAGGVVMQFQAPEPSSALLVAFSGVGLLLRRRRLA